MDLGPLIVLTGTLHVEGGIDKKVRSRAKHGATRLVTESRKISPRRGQANVVVTDVMRRIRQLRLLRTPFGTLFAADDLERVQAIIGQATKDVDEFNAGDPSDECRLTNTLVWEHLAGNRLGAVTNYLNKHRRDAEVKAALPRLAEKAAA